jgi:hypothetical protein
MPRDGAIIFGGLIENPTATLRANRRKLCRSLLVGTVNHTSVCQPLPIAHP